MLYDISRFPVSGRYFIFVSYLTLVGHFAADFLVIRNVLQHFDPLTPMICLLINSAILRILTFYHILWPSPQFNIRENTDKVSLISYVDDRHLLIAFIHRVY